MPDKLVIIADFYGRVKPEPPMVGRISRGGSRNFKEGFYSEIWEQNVSAIYRGSYFQYFWSWIFMRFSAKGRLLGVKILLCPDKCKV